MFTLILSHQELSYIIQEFNIELGSNSILHHYITDIPRFKKSKIKKALLKGKTLIADGKSQRINTLVAGILGMMATPEDVIDLYSTHNELQERRYFVGKNGVFVGIVEDEDSLVMTSPVMENHIRDFVSGHFEAGEGSSQVLVFEGCEMISLSSILEYFRRDGEKSFSAKNLQKLISKKTLSHTAYETSFGECSLQDMTLSLENFLKKGYLKKSKKKYILEGNFLDLAKTMKHQKSLQITRANSKAKSGENVVRQLTLYQGQGKVYLAQTTLSKIPIIAFREISKTEIVVLSSMVALSAENFSHEFESLFTKKG